MTRTKRSCLATILPAAMSLLALAGCGPRGPIEPIEDTHPWPQINLSDRDLARRMVVRKPVVERDKAGLLYITVPVRSTTGSEFTLEHRATYYDRNHTPIFQS